MEKVWTELTARKISKSETKKLFEESIQEEINILTNGKVIALRSARS